MSQGVRRSEGAFWTILPQSLDVVRLLTVVTFGGAEFGPRVLTATHRPMPSRGALSETRLRDYRDK
jgi:hypothetical protein